MSRQLKTWEPRGCRVRGDSLSKVAKRQGPAPSRLPETSSWKVLLTGTYWGQDTQEGIAETFLELPSRGSCCSQEKAQRRDCSGTWGLEKQLPWGSSLSLSSHICMPTQYKPDSFLSLCLPLRPPHSARKPEWPENVCLQQVTLDW